MHRVVGAFRARVSLMRGNRCFCDSAVQSGYRMPKPASAPLEIYALMLACWQEDPAQRPTMASLEADLKRFLHALTPTPVGVVHSAHEEIVDGEAVYTTAQPSPASTTRARLDTGGAVGPTAGTNYVAMVEQASPTAGLFYSPLSQAPAQVDAEDQGDSDVYEYAPSSTTSAGALTAAGYVRPGAATEAWYNMPLYDQDPAAAAATATDFAPAKGLPSRPSESREGSGDARGHGDVGFPSRLEMPAESSTPRYLSEGAVESLAAAAHPQGGAVVRQRNSSSHGVVIPPRSMVQVRTRPSRDLDQDQSLA
jgi:hypothetical protein